MRVDVEQDRQREIARYRAIEDPAGPELQALVSLAAQVCDVPTAVLSVMTPDHTHQIAAEGVEPAVCERNDAMCALVLDEPEVVVTDDARLDPRFEDHPLVDGTMAEVRFYATAPLISESGVAFGRLCVFDGTPRPLPEEQRAALMTLAERIVDALTLRRRTRELELSLEALTATRDELRRSNEHLTLFAGQVSHDLRTPLTAILANAEMLTSEPAVADDADVQWMVDGVQRAGNRMDRMIEEMLAYARVGGSLQREATALDGVVATVLEDLASAVNASGAEVVVDELPTLPCDAGQIRAVLLNLLTNALKFSRPDEPPLVRVYAERAGDRWRILVSDQGIGVPADRRETMFVLFARADKRVEGSGIGLATAKRIVEAHGGRIGMDETPGGGTTVWFDLPA